MSRNKRTRKQYKQPSKFNPIQQSAKLDKLSIRVNELSDTIDSLTVNHERHVEMLANFVRHDIKNGIQSIDGIVYNSDVDESTKAELKLAVQVMRQSLDDFSKLSQVSNGEPFSINQLFASVDMLVKHNISTEKISLSFDYDKHDDVKLCQSYQSFCQIMHNLILNSIRALRDNNGDKLIKVKFTRSNIDATIEVYDNGCSITDTNKIWDYKYSTTGGTGIGLHHVRYLIEKIKGYCECKVLESNLHTKKIIINFPLK